MSHKRGGKAITGSPVLVVWDRLGDTLGSSTANCLRSGGVVPSTGELLGSVFGSFGRITGWVGELGLRGVLGSVSYGDGIARSFEVGFDVEVGV